MRPLPGALAIASVAIVTAFAIAATPPDGIPLIMVPQGVSLRTMGDTEIFIVREGSVVTAFPRVSRSSGGEAIVYCPNEEAFVAPESASLWTIRGALVAGPAGTDLDRIASRVDNDLILHLDPDRVQRARGRTRGQISGEAGDRYSRFRAGDRFARFCLGPVPFDPGRVARPDG